MEITVKTSTGEYNIYLGRGNIENLSTLLQINKRALIVTDSGVPEQYSKTVARQFSNSVIKVIPQGEQSKSFETYRTLLEILSQEGFTRSDCIVAVGGGVVGDLAGFTASTYMRGIDFYNIPTTLLSQVDSSIGGKTAIDFYGYKNTVGAFYQPKAVVIDPDVLSTLSHRQFNNGLSESIKMAATSDSELFELIENNDARDVIDTVIEKSLMIKKAVVEADEKEQGLRKVLNFGHTLAHAIETASDFSGFLHGECVAIGMMAFSCGEAKERLKRVLGNNGLPTMPDSVGNSVLEALRHDKKANSKGVNTVFVSEIGEFKFEFLDFSQLELRIKEAYLK